MGTALCSARRRWIQTAAEGYWFRAHWDVCKHGFGKGDDILGHVVGRADPPQAAW